MSAYRFRFWGKGPPELSTVASILKSHGAKRRKKDRFGSQWWDSKRDDFVVQMEISPKGGFFEKRGIFGETLLWLPVEGPVQISLQTLQCCSVDAATVIGRISAEIARSGGDKIWLEPIDGTHFNMLMDEAIADLESLFEFRIRRLARAIGREVIPPIACKTSNQCQKYLDKLIKQSGCGTNARTIISR